MTQVNIDDGCLYFVLAVLVKLNQFEFNSVAACVNESLMVMNAKEELEPVHANWTVEEML